MKKKYEMPSIEFLRVVTSKPLMGSVEVPEAIKFSEEDNFDCEEALSKQFGGGFWGTEDSNAQ